EGAQVGHRIGLRLGGHLGAVRLERPADEGGEPARPPLHLADPEEMLDPVGVGLTEPVHHRHRRLHALAMGFFLDAEPLVGLSLLLRDPLPDRVDEDLAAAARDAVEARLLELADDLGDLEPEPLAEENDLRRREPVDVDRMMALDVAHQLEIPLERDVRVVAALEKDLDPAERLTLVDLLTDLLE